MYSAKITFITQGSDRPVGGITKDFKNMAHVFNTQTWSFQKEGLERALELAYQVLEEVRQHAACFFCPKVSGNHAQLAVFRLEQEGAVEWAVYVYYDSEDGKIPVCVASGTLTICRVPPNDESAPRAPSAAPLHP